MKLLTSTYRSFQRLLGKDVWFSGCVLSILAVLEVVGRQFATDAHDFWAALLLALVGFVVSVRHRLQPLGWVNYLISLGRRLRASIGRYAFEIGIDLRGSPPLPRAYPPLISTALGLLLVWNLVLVAFLGSFPYEVRGVAIRVSYVGYLAGLLGLWAGLGFLIFLAMLFTRTLAHDLLIYAFSRAVRRSRRRELAIISCYFGALFLAWVYLPVWVALAICLLALAINLATIAIPANTDVKFIWRFRQGSEIYCVSWGTWVTCSFTIVTLLIVNLVLTTCGNLVLTNDVSAARAAMPVTSTLGLMLAWLAAGVLCGLVTQLVTARWRDPARPCRPVIHLTGEGVARHRSALKSLFVSLGWNVRVAPAQPQPTDVGVEIVASTAEERVEGWPLRVRFADVDKPEVLERLTRRDEIQNRRRLVSGLELLFKRQARRKHRPGTGCSVAPHFWFIAGLVRDARDDEDDLEEGTIWHGTIGPSYHQVLPRCARHHIYRILRGVQIDMIYVEDGVGFRRFARVLRLMFEHFDIYGGQRKADEIHFQGVPGTRVLIHEFQLNEPFKSEVYPEPEFENLGRAHILHIFRDRGEQFERVEPPGDQSWVPAPSMAF